MCIRRARFPLAMAVASLFMLPNRAISGDLVRTLRKPEPVAFDFFGDALAVLDRQLLVGAPFDDLGETDSGVAYLYDADTGQLEQTFLNPTPERGDYYGKSVASLGHNVLIGSSGEALGRAYIRDPATAEVLVALEGFETGSYFGHSVASAGGRALVGAFKENRGAGNSGAAYLFDPTTGELLQTYVNPTPSNADYFAETLAGTADRVLVGTAGDDTVGFDAGAVYLFDALSGDLLHSIFNPSPGISDEFGRAVAFKGDDLLVGVPFADDGPRNAGIVYLFDGQTGDLLQTFRNPAPLQEDQFGAALAVLGNDVVVGAPGGFGRPGTAYLFDGDTGRLRATFRAPPTSGFNAFGAHVAVVGNLIAVGAPTDTGSVGKAGAVFLFAVVPEPATAALLLLPTCALAACRPRREANSPTPS